MAATDLLLIDNSGLAWIIGLVDDADPTNDDGTPKTIDDAEVDWELLDENSQQVAAGSGVAVENGRYRIDLSHAINFAIAETLHVTVTIGDYVVNILRDVGSKSRSGMTPNT
jgi:hypothetical protein